MPGAIAQCTRGDAFFVPAGTAHTIGPGMVLCEMQQHSDVTYRVFDYGRRQPTEPSARCTCVRRMDVMNFDAQRGGKIYPARATGRWRRNLHLVACRYFAVESWEFAKQLSTTFRNPRISSCWIVLAGKGRIAWAAAVGKTGSLRLFRR